MTIGRRQLVKLGLGMVGGGLASVEGRETFADLAKGDERAMDAWWVDLEKDEPKASRALLKFSAQPGDSVAYFRVKLKPLKLDKARLQELLTQLGSVDASLWAPAFEELNYFDPRLATELETLMNEVNDSPKRQRMVCLMSGRPADDLDGHQVDLRKFDTGHNFFSPDMGSWWAEVDVEKINSHSWNNPKFKWTRAVRAIALLEHIGSPDAIALLKEVAGGHPLAQPTRVAHEALQRLVVKPD